MMPFFRHADTSGKGLGNVHMNVDGSGAPVVFKLSPRPDPASVLGEDDEHGMGVAVMVLFIRDSGGFRADRFGARPPLANGFTIRHFHNDGSLIQCTCDGIPWRTNADIARACSSVSLLSFGAGDDFLAARWVFADAGAPFHVAHDEYLAVVINDNLTALGDFTCHFQGLVYH